VRDNVRDRKKSRRTPLPNPNLLSLISEVRFKLVRCLSNVLFVSDVVAVKDTARAVAQKRLGHALRYAAAIEVPGRRMSKIMKPAPLALCGFGGAFPGNIEVIDLSPIAMEDVRTTQNPPFHSPLKDLPQVGSHNDRSRLLVL
jgi:hypothetical protein